MTDNALSSPPAQVAVLMVCMGNICRSPTAEGVLRRQLQDAGLDGWVRLDSAGTHAYHVGNPPDERAQDHARQRGYELADLRARQINDADFEQFDLILAMDWDNLALLEAECPDEPGLRHKLRRLTEFVPPQSPLAGAQVVPDPYYGGPEGFDHVLDLVEAACEGLVQHLQQRLSSTRGWPAQ